VAPRRLQANPSHPHTYRVKIFHHNVYVKIRFGNPSKRKTTPYQVSQNSPAKLNIFIANIKYWNTVSTFLIALCKLQIPLEVNPRPS
jgi:hypothetical protein